MNRGNIVRRITTLEEEQHGDTLRVVMVYPGEPEPVQQPGEHLVVLHVQDMGE